MPWQVTPSIASGVDRDSAGRGASAAFGIDLENEIIRRMRAALFAHEVLDAGREAAAPLAGLASRFPDIFTAKEKTTPPEPFGPPHPELQSLATGGVRRRVPATDSEPPAENGLIIRVRATAARDHERGADPATAHAEDTSSRSGPVPHTPQPRDLPPQRTGSRRGRPLGVAGLRSPRRSRPAPFFRQAPDLRSEACNAIGQKYFDRSS